MIITLVQSPSITLTDFKANLEKIILGTMTTTVSGGKTIPTNLDNVISSQCEVVGTLSSGIYSKLDTDTYKKIHNQGSQYGIAKLTFVYSGDNLDYIGVVPIDGSNTPLGETDERTFNGNDVPCLAEKISIVITDKIFYIEDTTTGLASTGNGFFRVVADFQPAFISTKYTDIMHIAQCYDDDIENTWRCSWYHNIDVPAYQAINFTLIEQFNKYVETFGKKWIVQTPCTITGVSQYHNIEGIKCVSNQPYVMGGKIIYNSDQSKYSLISTAYSSSGNYYAIEG